MLIFKKLSTILGLIIVFISGCAVIPKPDYSKNRTVLIIPLQMVNETKYKILSTFKIYIKSESTYKTFNYLSSPNNSTTFKIISDLPPGKYTFKKIEIIGADKKKHTLNVNEKIILEQSKITIHSKTLYYEQKPIGGSNWYQRRWRLKNTTSIAKNKIKNNLGSQENISLWSYYTPSSTTTTSSTTYKAADNCSREKWLKASNTDTKYSLNQFKSNCNDSTNQYYKLAVSRLDFKRQQEDKCSRSAWVKASNTNTLDSLRGFTTQCNDTSNQYYKLAQQSLTTKLDQQKAESNKIAVPEITEPSGKNDVGRAIIVPIAVMGEISEVQKTIIYNKFLDVVSNDHDLVSQEEYERAEEEAFQQMDYDECTEDQCMRIIQEFLQVEDMYKLQLIKEEEDTQVSLTYLDLDKKLVKTDFCEGCKTSALIKMINKLYSDLGKKR